MRRLVFLVPFVLLLAACGGSSKPAAAPASPSTVLGSGAKTLYQSAGWAVVVRGGKAVVAHLVGATWQVDRSGSVKIRVLGPAATATPQTQVAAELSAPAALVEDALWVDGKELLEKGGGLKPSQVTIYGTTAGPLARGQHVAVAYGRTGTTGSAVAWIFRVV